MENKLLGFTRPIVVTIVVTKGLKTQPELGDLLDLNYRANNPKDPNAIEVERSGKVVGYVANNDERTVLPKTVSATVIQEMIKDCGVELDGLYARLAAEGTVPDKNGDQMKAFKAIVFAIPSAQKSDKPPITCRFKILQTMYLNSSVFLGKMKALQDAVQEDDPTGKACGWYGKSIYYRKISGPSVGNVVVGAFESPSIEPTLANAIAGLPAEDGSAEFRKTVLSLLNEANAVETTLVGLEIQTDKGSFMTLQVAPDAEQDEKFREEIRSAVLRGCGSWELISDRVKYMASEMVPASLIKRIISEQMDPEFTVRYFQKVSTPKTRYHQRDGMGELTKMLAYRCKRLNTRLVGEKGSGKNTLAETVDWLLGRPFYRLQGNANMDKADLLGQTELRGGETSHRLSDMLKAATIGADIILDECNCIPPDVAELLNSLMDNARSIEVPNYGKVKIHERTTFTLTMNEGYVGTGLLNQALADRCSPIHMAPANSIADVLRLECPDASPNDIKACDKVYAEILKKITGVDQTLDNEAMTIRGFIDALRVSEYLGLKEALISCVAGRPQTAEYRAEIGEIIEAQMP